MADAEIEDMRKQMTSAAQMDAISRREGKPAMHKLKMLPEVVSLLNRNQYTSSLVDPEINLLEAVKFFLEPLDDGSLPAYNIQRDLMTSLAKLPINKETLVASGIGKVIVFYTKVKRVEPGIKRMAERLLAEWTRPILQRSDDYSKRVYEEVAYDPRYAALSESLDALLTRAAKSRHVFLPPRPLRPKCARENFCRLASPTALGRTLSTRATRSCRGRRWCRRASSRGLWEPAERIDSERCGRDRLGRRRGVGSSCGFGTLLSWTSWTTTWTALGFILFLLRMHPFDIGSYDFGREQRVFSGNGTGSESPTKMPAGRLVKCRRK